MHLSFWARQHFPVAFLQAVKRRSRALGWLAALLAMYPGGPQLKVKGGGGLAAIARQKKLPVRPAHSGSSQWPFSRCGWQRPDAERLGRTHRMTMG